MNDSQDELNLPTSRYLDKKKLDAKARISKVFDEYKELLSDQTHPDNQTPAYNQRVMKTLQRLLTAADELDSVSPGEGIFGLMVLSLRTSLKLKDENTKVRKELRDIRLEMKRLKNK